MTTLHIHATPAGPVLDTARALVLRLEPDGDRDELVTALDERVRTLRGAYWLFSRNQ
jgi:hypothetical protein